jgi:hypothetical protein
MLTKEERHARLQFFLGTARAFKLRYHSKDTSVSTCTSLLRELQSLRNVTILSPAAASDRDSNAISSDSLKSCPELDLDRLYFLNKRNSHSSTPNDVPFSKRLRTEKESLATAVCKASANFELYDLSPYLGKGIAGYFAEGTLCRENGPKQCYMGLGYGNTIGKLVDLNTCSVGTPDTLPISRLGARIVSFKQPWSPFTTPSFYAFVTINNHLYRIIFSSGVDTSDFSSLSHLFKLKDSPTTLSIELPSNSPLTVTPICMFNPDQD